MKLIPVSETRRRMGGVSAMTDWRWRHEDRLLPLPIKINGRNFDIEAEIDQIYNATILNTPRDQIVAMVEGFNAARVREHEAA